MVKMEVVIYWNSLERRLSCGRDQPLLGFGGSAKRSSMVGSLLGFRVGVILFWWLTKLGNREEHC